MIDYVLLSKRGRRLVRLGLPVDLSNESGTSKVETIREINTATKRSLSDKTMSA
jgi:hypothetical protein